MKTFFSDFEKKVIDRMISLDEEEVVVADDSEWG